MFNKKRKNSNFNIHENNNSIFNFINPNNNDILSDMSGIELQEFLYYLEMYYLQLRTTLNLNKHTTFGLELEFKNTNIKNIEKELKKQNLNNTWKIKPEKVIINGLEINSPILKDTDTSWNNLETICSILRKNAITDTECGGHIHIGTQVLGPQKESWLNFIKLWSIYENIIYRFSYGDYLCARKTIQNYAKPVSKTFWQDYQDLIHCEYINIYDIISKISHQRKQAINFYNITNFTNIEEKNTIEFRCPNSSHKFDPIIWQNNVNFFVNLLAYCKSSRYNNNILDQRRYLNKDKYSSLNWYNEIYLEQALELCDMLFTNNLDKIYFLRQYLKSFEIGTKESDKAKTFTKTLIK